MGPEYPRRGDRRTKSGGYTSGRCDSSRRIDRRRANRARLRVDETGYYEYESIKPGKYQIGENAWRPPHIHYMVAAPGYKTLVTQLYFSGEAENKTDSFIRPSLIIDLATVKVSRGAFKLGTFDIVLAKS